MSIAQLDTRFCGVRTDSGGIVEKLVDNLFDTTIFGLRIIRLACCPAFLRPSQVGLEARGGGAWCSYLQSGSDQSPIALI